MAFLAIDLETDGLDEHGGKILEVAWAVGETIDAIDIECDIRSAVILATDLRLNPFVARMHAESGLLTDLLDGPAFELSSVENEIIYALCAFDSKGHILVGSSVHFDHRWIDEHMPGLAGMLSHRHIDATSDWMLDQQAGIPDAEPPTIGTKHRAASDIATSLWCLQRSLERRRR